MFSYRPSLNIKFSFPISNGNQKRCDDIEAILHCCIKCYLILLHTVTNYYTSCCHYNLPWIEGSLSLFNSFLIHSIACSIHANASYTTNARASIFLTASGTGMTKYVLVLVQNDTRQPSRPRPCISYILAWCNHILSCFTGVQITNAMSFLILLGVEVSWCGGAWNPIGQIVLE